MDPYYSTSSRSISGPVPYNTVGDGYASLGGKFEVERFKQKDVLDVIREQTTTLKAFEISIGSVVKEVYRSVGMVMCGSDQIGSCTLIAANLAIVPCHCIEALDVSKLTLLIGQYSDNVQKISIPGKQYLIKGVVEHDPELDYAVVLLEGAPGIEYGFARIESDCDLVENPVLIHHPIGKCLKASVAPFVRNAYYSLTLQTYHDSDYGSSGGGYFSPSGSLVAIHEGSERELDGWNLVRLALPIRRILDTHPDGIVANIAYQNFDPKQSFYTQRYLEAIPYCPREYVDLELYDRSKLKGFGYVLRDPDEAPGIIIDHHQGKHSSWPIPYSGGKGSKFPKGITLDDIIDIAQAISISYPLFRTFSPSKGQDHWELDKQLLGKTLFKKLTNVEKIGIEFGWIAENNSWEMHLYPVLSKKYS